MRSSNQENILTRTCIGSPCLPYRDTQSYAARIDQPSANICSGSPTVLVNCTYTARIAQPNSPDCDTSQRRWEGQRYAGRIALRKEGVTNIKMPIKAVSRAGFARFHLQTEVSTNSLPSNYGFNAAAITTNSQHGDVNPLSKE